MVNFILCQLYHTPHKSAHKKEKKVFEKNILSGFAGGTVAKNLSANSGNVGLIPGPARSHMLQSN